MKIMSKHTDTRKLNWIAPYESPYRILKKVKLANAATTRDIFEVFGSSFVKSKKTKYHGEYLRNLITLEGLDEETLT